MHNRTAIYARVSSEQQVNSKTIESQIRAVLERAEFDQQVVSDELKFIDDGYSGATLIRPALEKLRDAVYNGAVDRLYVHSPDRLSRKYAYQILLVDEFKRAGVNVIFLNARVADTPEDELLLQIQGIISEYERAKILERSRRGRLHAARRGDVSVFGAAPYGYQYVAKKYAPDRTARFEIIPEEARVVKQVFRWICKDGMTLSGVCRKLKHKGIKTRSGKVWWSTKTILGMLRNPAYTGQACFGRTKLGPRRPSLRLPKGRTEKVSRQTSIYSAPAEHWIKIAVPPLVTADVFEAAQNRVRENRLCWEERKHKARYLLQGLVVCKICGYALYGKPTWFHKNDLFYVYYRCAGTDPYRAGGKRVCSNKVIRGDFLEQLVWNESATRSEQSGG